MYMRTINENLNFLLLISLHKTSDLQLFAAKTIIFIQTDLKIKN